MVRTLFTAFNRVCGSELGTAEVVVDDQSWKHQERNRQHGQTGHHDRDHDNGPTRPLTATTRSPHSHRLPGQNWTPCTYVVRAPAIAS